MTNSRTPIQSFWDAVYAKDYETVRNAIANGIDANARIPDKVAPIILAQQASNMGMLKILWEAGAQPATPWLEDVFADFETGGDGSKFMPQKKPSVGKFVLHRFNGDEEFALEEASIRITQDKQGDLVLELEAISNGTVIKSLPDTAGLLGSPNASLYVTISRSEMTSLVGIKLSVPDSYDELIEDFRTNFYYVEHEALEANEIEFLAFKGNQYWVKWISQTLDVNYYDGSKPDTHIEIEGWFTMENLIYSEVSE